MIALIRRPETVWDAMQQGVSFLSAGGVASARLEAEVMLSHLLGQNRAGLLARLRDPWENEKTEVWEQMLTRRAAGCPLQYLTGVQEFWGMPFKVNPGVLIPRSETELLVQETLTLLAELNQTKQTSQAKQAKSDGGCQDHSLLLVADVGTGSGALAVAVAKDCPQAAVAAIDISPAALETARLNALQNGVSQQIQFYLGDLLEPLRPNLESMDLIVSNPPYIPTKDISGLQREVADFEPRLALDGGPDGLDIYRRLTREAMAMLKPGAWLMVEIGYDQGDSVSELFKQAGYEHIEVLPDWQGHPRIVKGKNRV